MNVVRATALLAVAGLLAACSTGTAGTPTASPGPLSVDVRLTDALRIEPAVISVPAGEPVTFVVTNTGAADHEFFVGTEDEQAMHEAEMQEMGGMAHDEDMGVGVKPGETKELTVTFAGARPMLAGCHVPGHYAGGMKATIEIGS